MLPYSTSRALSERLRMSPACLKLASHELRICSRLTSRTSPRIFSRCLTQSTDDAPATNANFPSREPAKLTERQRAERSNIPGLTIKSDLGKKNRGLVRVFNFWLKRAARALYSDQPRQELWNSYLELKKKNPDVIHVIPDAAWKRLWTTQSSFRPSDPDRLSNLIILLEDMKIIGLCTKSESEVLKLEIRFAEEQKRNSYLESKDCNLEQELSIIPTTFETKRASEIPLVPRIESHQKQLNPEAKLLARRRQYGSRRTLQRLQVEEKFREGSHEEATVEWEANLAKREPLKNNRKEWLELGIRLYTVAGNFTRAKEILTAMTRRYPNCDPRFIVFLIRHLNHLGRPSDMEKAWWLFVDLRSHRTFQMAVDDFQTIFEGFLQGGQPLLAAKVLRNLIEDHGSKLEHRYRIFGAFVRSAFSHCQKLTEIDQVSLELVPVLPDKNAADLFYTGLIDTLRHRGEIDQMAQVVERMYEAGYDPAPWHVDSLIRSWMSSENTVSQSAAESMAWAMIQKRKQIAEHCSPTGTFVQETARKLRLPAMFRRQLPAAGSYTYKALMRFYAEKGETETAKQVLQLLNFSSDIHLSSHMISAILTVHLLAKDIRGAWEFFQFAAKDECTVINLRTYGILWKGLYLHLCINKGRGLEGYPSPRELFANMLHYLVFRHPDWELPIREKTQPSFHDRILQTFCHSGDPIGALLAMNALNHFLGFRPTLKTIETFVEHAARWLALQSQEAGQLRPYEELVPASRDFLEYLHGEIFTSKSSPAPDAAVIYSNEFHEKNDDLRKLLTEFLRRHIHDRFQNVQKYHEVFDNARNQMGLDLFNGSGVAGDTT